MKKLLALVATVAAVLVCCEPGDVTASDGLDTPTWQSEPLTPDTAPISSGAVFTIGEWNTVPINVPPHSQLNLRYGMHRTGEHIIADCAGRGGRIEFKPLPFHLAYNGYLCADIDY